MPEARPTLLYLIKQVELAVRAGLDELVRPEGVTTLQYTALTVLEAHSGLTAAELARRSFVTAQSTSDLVAALLGRGLVERHRDPDDRRRLVLELTADGRAVLARLAPLVTALETAMVAGLTPAAVATLRAGLDRARMALEDGTQ